VNRFLTRLIGKLTHHTTCARACVLLGLAFLTGCSTHQPRTDVAQPDIIPHATWQATPPIGYAADAVRRNLPRGGRLNFHDLTLTVVASSADTASAARTNDSVTLRLLRADSTTDIEVAEGSAFNWHGYHVAVVGVYGRGELGAGLVALEVATLASLSAVVADSKIAGGADLRLRVPHRITHVTLHHTGSAQPLRAQDDPAQVLRNLQSWGARDRNWWDVPYHFLIDLDGRLYEGRDWRYIGETNTSYNPEGHFLVSVIGNYELQEATPAQLEAIADLMAWAFDRFNLPIDRLGGHYHYFDGTSCPGQHLRKYLEDGTLRRMIEARLAGRRAAS